MFMLGYRKVERSHRSDQPDGVQDRARMSARLERSFKAYGRGSEEDDWVGPARADPATLFQMRGLGELPRCRIDDLDIRPDNLLISAEKR